MVLKIKNGELAEYVSRLDEVMKDKIQLPVKVSYKIVKNKLAIEEAMKAFRIMHDQIINDHSNGEGQIAKDNPEFNEVVKEIAVINNEETEVNLDAISISEFGRKDVPLDLISALGFMLEE